MLANLGFDQIDAQVYVYLAKKGMHKASAICRALKLTKQQLYPCLKRLQGKGIVSSTIEHPARFSATPFEKVMDLFIKAKMKETQSLQQSKAEILSNWQNLKLAEDEASAKFTVIEGRSFIYSRIQQMIQETKNHVLAITTIPSLMQADQQGIFDAGFHHPLKSKIQFRFLAELSQQNLNVMKALLRETTKAKLNFSGRNPDLGLSMFPQMIIRDEKEALFFIRPRTEASIIEQDDLCLWTDCATLVQAFTSVFEELWHNATDIDKKIAEIETGKPTPKTYIIADPEMAEKKYEATLQLAKEEIIMITSSKGLIECCKNTPLFEKQAKNGISVKIMAPITRDNLKAAERLSKFCGIRHATINYLGTAIVDGKHLFQFKTRSQVQEKIESTPNFENTFYSNDLEYLEKNKNTLYNIWKNAHKPSSFTLDSIVGPHGSSLLSLFENPYKKVRGINVINEKPLGTMTEEEVLSKIIKAKKIPAKDPEKDVLRLYGSQGIAIVHPPDHFKLPDMMLFAFHVDKETTFGAEDILIVALWLGTPKGHAYLPVVFAGDNPRSVGVWKQLLAATPAAQNVQILRKEELQVQVHGNTLFAGWTVTLPLFPPQYSLPPACLRVEGYGDVKTVGYTVIPPSGHKHTVEQNYFEAFVTFMHPKSKYSGPGTDGLFLRDYIVTVTPP
jgi:sugar-specific transcriptional regulator TrmB